MFSSFSRSKYTTALLLVCLVVGAFFIAQTTVVFGAQLAYSVGLLREDDIRSVLFQLFVAAIAYALTLVVILFVYNIFHTIKNRKRLRKLLALKWNITPKTLLYTGGGYLCYVVTSVLVLWLVTILFPSLDINQEQVIGFEGVSGLFENVLAFVALVVLAPIAEEVIFRGFLYTKLREKLHMWASIIIVSVVFGAIHLQWNVGIDVAVLSVVLCLIREKTSSIWAGVGIHMLKNGLAYAVLFGGLQIDRLITG